jgi:hypothetical protein
MIDMTQPESDYKTNLIPLVEGGIILQWPARENDKAAICFTLDGKKWRIQGDIREVR